MRPETSEPSTETARFIAGMPRSGTHWLIKLFNEHPDTAGFGETFFWSRWHVPPGADGRYDEGQIFRIVQRLKRDAIRSVIGEGPGFLKRINEQNIGPLLDQMLAARPGPMTPAELFCNVGAAIAEGEGARFPIEKTPNHVNWIDRIIRAMPGALMVVMMREPYSFLLSYKHLLDSRSEALRREGRWRYHPLLGALVWRGIVRSARAAQQAYPDQVEVVWLDEIKRDSAEVVRRIQAFFRIPVIDDLAARVPPDNTSFPGGQRPELKGEDVFWMNLLAGRVIADSGFIRRPTPFQPFRIALSILILPAWSIWKIIKLRRLSSGSLTAYLWRYFRPMRAGAA